MKKALLQSPADVLPLSIACRRMIAYGAGNALLGLQNAGAAAFEYVVDDTPGYAGQKVGNLLIYPSAQLLKENTDEVFVVICAQTSTTASRIAKRLERLGMRPGEHFADCAVLQVQSMARRLSLSLGFDADLRMLEPLLQFSAVSMVPNLSGTGGTWLFLALFGALEQSGISGDIAECGIYHGANALSALTVSQALRSRDYHLLDSFEGLQELSSADPETRRGEFSDTAIESVRSLFVPFSRARIHVGLFEDTLPMLSDRSWALAYIDCDLAEPARFCAEYFWNRLSPGGILLVHDYWFSPVPLPAGAPAPFSGIRAVMDKFMEGRPLQAAVFPETSHLVIRKPASPREPLES